jgi:uncharacterized membrane protein
MIDNIAVQGGNIADVAGAVTGGLGGFTGIFSGVSAWLPYIAIGAVVIGIAYWVINRSTYNKKVVLRKLLGGRVKTYTDMAKRVTDKDGVPYWKLYKHNINGQKLIDIPPDEVKDVTSDGNDWAECYVTESGQIIWKKDNFDLEAYMRKNKYRTKKEEQEAEEKGEVTTGFKPVSTTQRASYAHQIENAKKYNSNFFKDNAGLLIGGGTILIMFAIFILFFGNITEPSIQMQEKINEGKQIDQRTLEIIQQIEEDVSTISTEENQGTPANQTNGGEESAS